MSEVRISNCIDDSIVDGPGIRFTVFTQGCPHRCEGCHNPQTHDFADGVMVDTDEIFDKIKANPLLKGVTFSGGEPFCQVRPLLDLARRIRRETTLDIVIFTGYTIEELLARRDADTDELISYARMIIDGKFELDKRDISLLYRGSANQRLLDGARSAAERRAVPWKDESKTPFDLY